MSTYPVWLAGMQVTAGRLTARQWNATVKQTRETVTSSTTYQDDDELAFPVAANAAYLGRFVYGVDGATGGDIKTRYSVPAGATGFKWCVGPQSGATDRDDTQMVSAVHGYTTDRPYGTVAATSSAITVVEWLMVQTAGTSGEVRLQWAQNASSGTATAVLDRSLVAWTRVG